MQLAATVKRCYRAACLCVCAFLAVSCGSLLSEVERIQRKYDASNGGGAACSAPSVGAISEVYPGFSNWTQYVRNDGTTPFSATGVSCTLAASEGHYNSCLHAGELKRVPVTNRTSCQGLSASDALGAFKWTCALIGGVPNMVSGGLADEKYLSDLIDFSGAGSWRPNSVTVTDSCGSATTASTAWYTNTFSKDITAGGTITLNSPGTIFIYSTNQNRPISIASNHTALVSAPAVILTTTATGSHISTGVNFLWLEATTNSANATASSLDLSGCRFCVVRGSNFSRQTVLLNNTYSCRIGYTRLFDATLDFDGGTSNLNNFFHDVMISNGRHDFSFVSSSNNIFLNYTLLNADYGFSNGNGPVDDFNIVINHTGANFDTSGVRGNTMVDNTFMNIAYANSAGTGIGAGGARNSYINVAVGNSDNGISSDGNREFYSGIIKVGVTGTACSESVASPGISNTCTIPAGAASDFTFTNTLNLATSFVGKVTADDSVNTEVSSARTLGTIVDYFRFESRWRAWGKENAAAAFSTLHRGYCSGTCRIWDLRLQASDNQIREILPIPTAANEYVHRWQASSAANCLINKGAISRDNVCTMPGYADQTSCLTAGGQWGSGAPVTLCSSRALRNAYEILNDGRGNDNGLCESGEACIYTPNIGSYQGHGQLNYVGSVSGGNFTNVDLYRYETNGI